MNESKLTVHPLLQEFVESELLPDLGLDAKRFWQDLEKIIDELSEENRRLLAARDEMQASIDAYCKSAADAGWDNARYRNLLAEIGYLEPGGAPFCIDTENVDREIAAVAGPQLVVPVSNARFALNAANARWGSLYDALYGTDVIPDDDGCAAGGAYNPRRGERVVRYATNFLDDIAPLATGRHADVAEYSVEQDAGVAKLTIVLKDGARTALRRDDTFVGYSGEAAKRKIVLENNGLHVEIRIDPDHPIGKTSAAGVSDIVLESALTTIQDCEDSVAAVDAEDKVGVYRNWLGLMRGTLEASVEKGGKAFTRRLADDKTYTRPDGEPLVLPGRSLMLVRNVGHLMTTDAIRDGKGNDVFEGILDAVMTTACALFDLREKSRVSNSRTGSMYIVKPKMHGSAEVAFADRLFARVEDMFGLERYTVKIGVMDEERRTTVNLEECIRAVRHRLVFINTGFLDRTGDEIHTSMLAAPMLRKEAIKQQPWIDAYEDRNVDVGIRCGLPGKAQIGKGMWPKPDEMLQMVKTKQSHPEAGANCAWVPSPTAATLHAMHYHYVDVFARQQDIASRPMASRDTILVPPFGDSTELSPDDIQAELDNNAQGILGYVVRWIDQGVGCSKVPDIDDVGLMEDRATLRISSQHIANWLYHGVCDEAQVVETFRRMAKIVDGQNASDPDYSPLADDFDGSIAFRAACELAFKGTQQPNGYTEPLLHAYRRKKKAAG